MRRSNKIALICLAAAVVILLSLPILISMGQEAAQRRRLVEELRRQEIYELDFNYIANHSIFEVNYMVCEPPADRQQLAEQIDRYLTEQDVVPKLIQRAKEKMESLDCHFLPYRGMRLQFLEPYSELRIGDFPESVYDRCPSYKSHVLVYVYVSYHRDAFYIPEPDFELEYVLR